MISIPQSSKNLVNHPIFEIENITSPPRKGEIVLRVTKSSIDSISNYFGSEILVGDWFTIKAQNSNNTSTLFAEDLVKVSGKTSLQLSKGLNRYLKIPPNQKFIISPLEHIHRESDPKIRNECPYIARLYFYRNSVVSNVPGRVREYLNLESNSSVEFETEQFNIQTKIQGEGKLTIPREDFPFNPRQKMIHEQVHLERLNSIPKLSMPLNPQSFQIQKDSISGGTGKKPFYVLLTSQEVSRFRSSHGYLFQDDLVHGTLKNCRSGKQTTFLVPIQAQMRFYFSLPLVKKCDIQQGDPISLKINKIFQRRSLGQFSSKLSFDVNYTRYSYESRITLPISITELFGLKKHDLLKLSLNGQCFTLKICSKRRVIISGKCPLGLLPGSQKVITVSLTKIGKKGKIKRLQRLGKKHTNLKSIIQTLIAKNLIPEIQSVDQIEPRYTNDENSIVQPDLRVILRENKLAHVEIKAFNSLARIGLKYEGQFKKYYSLGLPLILITTTSISNIDPRLHNYFIKIIAFEHLEEIIRKSNLLDFQVQLENIRKRIQ